MSTSAQQTMLDTALAPIDEDMTLVQAMRAAALGMQTAGLDPYGVVSRLLTDGANALADLSRAMEGCYGPMVVRYDGSGHKCGTPREDTRLCEACQKKRNAAIARLVAAWADVSLAEERQHG